MTRAFTLVELLAAIAIVAVLAAMAMPLLGIAGRQARRSATEATLRKTEAAIRLFRQDVDVLPYQASYPDAVDADHLFPNDLFRRLGRALGPAERQDLDALVAVAGGKFHYPEDPTSNAASEAAALPSALTYRIAYISPASHWDSWDAYGDPALVPLKQRRYAIVLNRIAQRRAMDAVLAGAFDLTGGVIRGPRSGGVVHRDLSGDALLDPGERAGAATGWCDDYLAGELPAAAVRGDSLLDAWGNPLILVGQVVPKGKALQTRYSQRVYGDSGGYAPQVYRIGEPIHWGLGARGFAARTGPWDDLLAADRPYLLGVGRIQLSPENAGDGRGVPAHPLYLPVATDLRASDRRYYAAPRLNLEPEVWSAGPDARFAWMRTDAANRDNVAAAAYDKGIP